MTTGAPPPADNGDDDRDQDLIDRLDRGLPTTSPEEAAARAPYERLLASIRDLPHTAPDLGWEERTAARWRASRAARRRRRWQLVAVGVAAVALAAAAVLLLRPHGRPAVGLEVAVLVPDGGVRRGEAALDDVLRLRAARRAAAVELRVYRDTELVARCPGAPACQVTAATLTLELPLSAPGVYRVLVLSSARPIPAPGPDGLDRDRLDAQSAGVTVESTTQVTIRG